MYRWHLESLRKKLTSRVALRRRLAGSGCDAGATTLRTATLALVHSTAECYTPVCCRSAHTRLIDLTINDALRIVTGCLRPTPADNLPILLGIQPVSSQWSHTISRTPCHGAWTFAPLSTHPPTECCCMAPQIETPVCTLCTATHQLLWQQHTCGTVGGSSIDCGVGRQPHKTPHFNSSHRYMPPPEWTSQEEPGSGLTAYTPVLDVSAPACTNGECPSLPPVSVVQKNKPSTMSSSNVQSIDLPTDFMAWRFWTMRQPNGCSTHAPKSSAAKQWIKQLAQTK